MPCSFDRSWIRDGFAQARFDAVILQRLRTDLHQRLDHHVGDLAAQVFGWCHPWGKGVIQDDAFSAFHDVEGYT